MHQYFSCSRGFSMHRHRGGSDASLSSSDSQFTEEADDDLTVLEACCECDEDALYDIIQDGITYELVNERDHSGKTGLSHACVNGFIPIVEILASTEDVDPNLPDKDGNTPLILSAQAGHADVISVLLNKFHSVKIDQSNHLGFTALMKAAIQGRTKGAKILLFAGANPNRRDHGRGLCAEEWARFCGRRACADAIAKYVHSRKYFIKKTLNRWNSDPCLTQKNKRSSAQEKENNGGWVKRHFSFRRRKRHAENESQSPLQESLKEAARCASSPLLSTSGPHGAAHADSPCESPAAARRPSCIDGVVPVNIIPRLKITNDQGIRESSIREEESERGNRVTSRSPPKILETDFDSEQSPDNRCENTTPVKQVPEMGRLSVRTRRKRQHKDNG